MSCVRFGGGIVTIADIYSFEGFLFQWHSYLGPTPVHKRTFDPRKTVPSGFYESVARWQKLSKKEQEKYRV